MNQYKIGRKLLSSFIAISFIVTSCMVTLVSAHNSPSNDVLPIYNDGETVVNGYTDDIGNIILSQYVNGTLVQRNTIFADNSEVIKREFFGSTATRKVSSNTINVNDYGVLVKSTVSTQSSPTRTLAGTINYRALIDSGYVSYGLKCTYTSTYTGPTTYTINEYVGTVVDLVSLLIGALAIPYTIVNPYVTALLYGAGVMVVGGIIKEKFTDTVSSNKTNYTWTLVDTTNSAHTKNVYGAKYLITDSKSAAKNKVYYEGYTPNDWKTQSLAIWFHDEMFSYSAWNVVSWS